MGAPSRSWKRQGTDFTPTPEPPEGKQSCSFPSRLTSRTVRYWICLKPQATIYSTLLFPLSSVLCTYIVGLQEMNKIRLTVKWGGWTEKCTQSLQHHEWQTAQMIKLLNSEFHGWSNVSIIKLLNVQLPKCKLPIWTTIINLSWSSQLNSTMSCNIKNDSYWRYSSFLNFNLCEHGQSTAPGFSI